MALFLLIFVGGFREMEQACENIFSFGFVNEAFEDENAGVEGETDQQRKDLVDYQDMKWRSNRLVVDVLIENGYRFLKKFGEGSFADVLLMRKPDRVSVAAMKLVDQYSVTEGEVSIWPNLQHQNVLAVEELFYFPEVESFVFVMEAQKASLDNMADDPDVMSSEMILQRVRKWIWQILAGLQYLHNHGLCHCDIKSNNVFVTEDGDCVICDFTFLQRTSTLVTNYGMPLCYRPPEACPVSRGVETAVEGTCVDMWCMGLLATEIMTRHGLGKKLSEVTDARWSTGIYPTMYSFLKKKELKKNLREAMPNAMLEKKSLKLIRNFLLSFLTLDAGHRATAEQAMAHLFLGKGSYKASKDAIWERKAKPKDIEKAVSVFHENLRQKPLEQKSLLPERRAPATIMYSLATRGIPVSCVQSKSEELTSETSVKPVGKVEEMSPEIDGTSGEMTSWHAKGDIGEVLLEKIGNGDRVSSSRIIAGGESLNGVQTVNAEKEETEERNLKEILCRPQRGVRRLTEWFRRVGRLFVCGRSRCFEH